MRSPNGRSVNTKQTQKQIWSNFTGFFWRSSFDSNAPLGTVTHANQFREPIAAEFLRATNVSTTCRHRAAKFGRLDAANALQKAIKPKQNVEIMQQSNVYEILHCSRDKKNW